MKKIIILFCLVISGSLNAQVTQPIVPAAPFKHVYDTLGLAGQQKEELQSFEIFRKGMYAQKPEAIPDTSARYSVRYKGSCWYAWVQSVEGDDLIGGEPRTYHCKLGTVDEKIYSMNELLAMYPGATLVVYGNRYAWLRSSVEIYYGNVTHHTSYTEYYLERVK